MRARRNYSYQFDNQKKEEDQFYETVHDLRLFKKRLLDANSKTTKDPFTGPNGLSALIKRGKPAPVSLPKMSWDK